MPLGTPRRGLTSPGRTGGRDTGARDAPDETATRRFLRLAMAEMPSFGLLALLRTLARRGVPTPAVGRGPVPHRMYRLTDSTTHAGFATPLISIVTASTV